MLLYGAAVLNDGQTYNLDGDRVLLEIPNLPVAAVLTPEAFINQALEFGVRNITADSDLTDDECDWYIEHNGKTHHPQGIEEVREWLNKLKN